MLLFKVAYVVKAKTHEDPLILISDDTYNDDEWHLVEFGREGPNAKLAIDDKFTKDGKLINDIQKLEISIPFYIGGLKPQDYTIVSKILVTNNLFIKN